MTADTKASVLVKGAAGLGNRILSMLTASLFASVANRRLLVDWRDPIFTGRSGIAPELFSELFVSPLVDPLPDPIIADTVTPALWSGRLDETLAVVGRDFDPLFFTKFGSFRNLAVSLRRIDYKEQMLVFWSWREVLRPLRPHLTRTDPRFNSMTNLEILREAAKRYLQPSPRVQSIVTQFESEKFRGKMLGLHIRATDLRAPVEKLLQVAARIVRQQSCDGVFCATDNLEVENRVRTMFPNVVTLPKQLPKGAIPLHYDPDCQDRVERATQALVDMLLLSKCAHLTFASRSSFGHVASVFAPEGQTLVDVDRFNPKVQVKQYVQSWTF